MASNTGWASSGEDGDQAQDLGSGGLLLARSLERDRRLSGSGCWPGHRRAAGERLAEPRVLRGELGLRWWPMSRAAGCLSLAPSATPDAPRTSRRTCANRRLLARPRISPTPAAHDDSNRERALLSDARTDPPSGGGIESVLDTVDEAVSRHAASRSVRDDAEPVRRRCPSPMRSTPRRWAVTSATAFLIGLSLVVFENDGGHAPGPNPDFALHRVLLR